METHCGIKTQFLDGGNTSTARFANNMDASSSSSSLTLPVFIDEMAHVDPEHLYTVVEPIVHELEGAMWSMGHLMRVAEQNAKMLQGVQLNTTGADWSDVTKTLHAAYKCNTDSHGEPLHSFATHFVDLVLCTDGTFAEPLRNKPYMDNMRVWINSRHSTDRSNSTTFHLYPHVSVFHRVELARAGPPHNTNLIRVLALTEFLANFPVILASWGAEKRAKTTNAQDDETYVCDNTGAEFVMKQNAPTLFHLLGAPRTAIIGKYTEAKLEQLRDAKAYCGPLYHLWDYAYDWLASAVLARFDEETVQKRKATEADDKREVVPDEDSRAAAGALSQTDTLADGEDPAEQSLVSRRDSNVGGKSQCCVM